MKRRLLGYLLIVVVIATYLLSFDDQPRVQTLLPHLPKPLAVEKALVTPIGQGPEGLIVSELCDQLNIRNTFYYWAQPQELQGYNSLILVLGFSKQGLYSLHKSEDEEVERALGLVQRAQQQQMPLILLHLGGADRRNPFGDDLAKVLVPKMDYVIVTQSSEGLGFFTELAAQADVPITVVPDIQAIKVPLNSVFR